MSRARRTTPLVFLLALLGFSVSGCGYFMKGPPTGHQNMASFNCDDSNTLPILDVIWAGLNLAGAVRATVETQPPGSPADLNEQVIIVGLSWGVISGMAAATGFSKASNCRKAKQQLAERRVNASAVAAASAANVELVKSVTILPLADTLQVGDTLQLSAAAYAEGGIKLPTAQFSWWSSNPEIASVDAQGLVTGLAPGSTTVGALAGLAAGGARLLVVAAP